MTDRKERGGKYIIRAVAGSETVSMRRTQIDIDRPLVEHASTITYMSPFSRLGGQKILCRILLNYKSILSINEHHDARLRLLAKTTTKNKTKKCLPTCGGYTLIQHHRFHRTILAQAELRATLKDVLHDVQASRASEPLLVRLLLRRQEVIYLYIYTV